ncbi:MAG: hypothetical protein MJE77_47585 [Proteobacteria bacterium]|nr:hypothetical protein [Pseudomonadota bacterium]
MALEIDVKLQRLVPLMELQQRVTDTLLAWFGTTTPRVIADGSDELLAEGAAAQLDIDGIALVSIQSTSAGSEEALGEDGGLWATFSAGEFRSPESLFLACLAAATAAQITGGCVVDEAGLVGPEREVTPEEFTARLREMMGAKQDFREASDAAFGAAFRDGSTLS